jgi:cytochrome aa3-600 menaquinol oxidase subunit 1
MLAMAAADYQYHNTYFLVSHFHYVLIAGTVFACFAGLIFWYPKMFGHKLNERIGKWFFWIFHDRALTSVSSRCISWAARNASPYLHIRSRRRLDCIELYSTFGAFMMAAGFIILCYNIYYSFRHSKREESGDAWGVGRTLEWATSSAIPPHYNFAVLPEVTSDDAFAQMKEDNVEIHPESKFKKFICRAIQADRLSCHYASDLLDSGLSLNGSGWESSV